MKKTNETREEVKFRYDRKKKDIGRSERNIE